MTRIPHPRRLLVLAFLVPVVALGACGGGGGNDNSGASAAGKGGASTTMAPGMSMPAGGSGGDAAAMGDKVQIADFTFKPSTVKVAAGTKVTFTNEDGFAHTATANDGSFDSKSLDKGESYEFTFDTPGTYAYKCSIHNSMTGTIVVE